MKYSVILKKGLIFIQFFCLSAFCASCASIDWPNLSDPLPAISDRQSARFSVLPIDLAVSPPAKTSVEDQSQIDIEELLNTITEQSNLLEINLQKSSQNRPVEHHWLKEQILLTRFDQLRMSLRRFIVYNQSKDMEKMAAINTDDTQIAAGRLDLTYQRAMQLSQFLHEWLGPEPPRKKQNR